MSRPAGQTKMRPFAHCGADGRLPPSTVRTRKRVWQDPRRTADGAPAFCILMTIRKLTGAPRVLSRLVAAAEISGHSEAEAGSAR